MGYVMETQLDTLDTHICHLDKMIKWGIPRSMAARKSNQKLSEIVQWDV
jgi:hypothetical protein